MNRRRFAFWISFAIFSLAERLRVYGLDQLAAAIVGGPSAAAANKPEHWIVANNDGWWWYERQHWIDGAWMSTGITTPVSRDSGDRLEGTPGYLNDRLVPAHVRVASDYANDEIVGETRDEHAHGRPDDERRARHGRPPSKWLRSLRADEIRIWLKTIDVPEAGVSGMTFWVHLTRDHSFDPAKIDGLNESEQAQLHAAAHYGY